MTPKLRDVKTKIRKTPEVRFLAEMIGECELPNATNGVTHQGVLLVNPRLACELSTDVLATRVRHEFKQAQELRQGVIGFH